MPPRRWTHGSGAHCRRRGAEQRLAGGPRNAERQRLEQQRRGTADWRLWGPYLAERAWGTVREDYSVGGDAWNDFTHDQARLRAYRWNEDGLGGICDVGQRLCLALALHNGADPFLKERAFGLTGAEGNRGEDVKEAYFYVDATPTHSYLHYLYKYPMQAFPYGELRSENRRRSRDDEPYNLQDTGVFDAGYWDVHVHYAKAGPDAVYLRLVVVNQSQRAARLHLLPTLWFRNTWSWGHPGTVRPVIRRAPVPTGARWGVEAQHETLGEYRLYGRSDAELLFTENDSNHELLWGGDNPGFYVKDAFHRRVVAGDATAVNPAARGTKFAAWTVVDAEPGERRRVDLLLTGQIVAEPFARTETTFARRRDEADVFFDDLEPEASPEDHRIVRQSLAGMIWSKQFYHYDVSRWLAGDEVEPPPQRRMGRNRRWQHLCASDVITMPDAWEYPWFAAWDQAYQCAALALVDIDLAKGQIELLLSERYLHPNGQIPAYEWDFGDTNPPVHAAFALRVFQREVLQRGKGDHNYLQRVFHKLLLNYSWWINRKDSEGHNLFEGGFLGLDNISAFDRSKQPLPPGYSLKQADATGWMAAYALNMTMIALELATVDPDYEDMAIQCHAQFAAIARAISGLDDNALSLWDDDDGFFKDAVVGPDGRHHRIDIFSWVGIIPLFACDVVDERLLANAPRFRARLERRRFDVPAFCQDAALVNRNGEHLIALIDSERLRRVLTRLLDEDEFLSPYGIRSLSRRHAGDDPVGYVPGVGPIRIRYEPGESATGLFGGNSNWRGPIWLPTNFSLVQALERYHRFLGDGYTVAAPCNDNRQMTLREIATLIADRLVDLYRRDDDGRIPALRPDSPFQQDPRWKDLYFFYEYFHAESGRGLGAAHQTGWTALLANLVRRHYRDLGTRR